MSLDLLGPASADHAVASRPSDSRVFGVNDTWFTPCSTPLAEDGTEIEANWLNGILAQIRNAIRGMGVAENNADDDMLLKAIRSQGIRYAVDTGAANVMVVTNARPIGTYTAGLVLLVQAANDVTGATTINSDGVGAKNVKRPDMSALTRGDWPAGGIGMLVFDGTQFQLLCVLGQGRSLAGQSLDLRGSAPGGGKTASWTVNELIVETALGGMPYKGASLTLSFNGAVIGAGGMDTGGTPTSGDLAVYAIYNPAAGTWSTLGTTASFGMIYSGAHMPSGYVASALIWSGKTDSNGNIIAFKQIDRDISVAPITIFSMLSGAASLTYQSLAAAVPINAKYVSGSLGVGSYNGLAYPEVASDAAGIGMQIGPGSANFIANYQPYLNFIDLPLTTAQVLYWQSGNAANTSCMMFVTRHKI